jgi:predicted nucleic acid-binding protein
MAINLKVNASVVDISSDSPKPEDTFLVDTNVWYWMTYSRASQTGARAYQVSSYPSYANKALACNSKIFQSGISLAELSHIIEKSEREIFNATNPAVSTKEYRHNFPSERNNVCLEIEAACMQVLSLADPLETSINNDLANAALQRLKTNAVDGYDLFLLETMATQGITQVITDDADFATVPGIVVFTANRTVLSAAKAQGQLIVR